MFINEELAAPKHASYCRGGFETRPYAWIFTGKPVITPLKHRFHPIVHLLQVTIISLTNFTSYETSMSPSPEIHSQFMEFMLEHNRPRMDGFKGWVFHSGMLFQAQEKWWGDQGPPGRSP